MKWLTALWASFVHWWTMRTCTKCGKVHHKSETTKNMFIMDGDYSCPECMDKWRAANRKAEHEYRVRQEMELLRAKEEARIRFEAERSQGAYRTPQVRVDDDCSTCNGLQDVVDACMNCGHGREASN